MGILGELIASFTGWMVPIRKSGPSYNNKMSNENNEETSSSVDNNDVATNFYADSNIRNRRQDAMDFPRLPREFEDMHKQMEQAFDDMFKLFGSDCIPFFDPHIPSIRGSDQQGQHEGNKHSEQNVREEFLRNRNGENVNGRSVRDKMLRGGNHFSGHGSDQLVKRDTDFDSIIASGGDLSDILDKERQQQPSSRPTVKSFYSFSSVVRTRLPDGTVEIKKITRDGDGNEHETIEVTKDESQKDLDMRSRFFKDHNMRDEDWVSRFFRW